MNLYAFYVRTGCEFDAQEEAEALGIVAHVPRRVDMIRQGKRRRPDPVTKPYLPNYVFAEASADEFHLLQQSKLFRSWMGINPASVRSVRAFIARVEADYTHRMAQIDAGERVQEYAPGDLLEIIAGPFKGQLARFQTIAEGAGIFPEVVAEIELMGQTAKVRLDVLAARKAVA